MIKINDIFKTESGLKAKVVDICVERDAFNGMIGTEIHMQVIGESDTVYTPITTSLRKFADLVALGKLVKE